MSQHLRKWEIMGKGVSLYSALQSPLGTQCTFLYRCDFSSHITYSCYLHHTEDFCPFIKALYLIFSLVVE